MERCWERRSQHPSADRVFDYRQGLKTLYGSWGFEDIEGTNADLVSLSISSLMPAVDPAVTEYTCTVSVGTGSLTITATPR